jgi:hypothetical protein
MSFRDDFLKDINDNLDSRIEEQGMRPTIELWPCEDADSHWVAFHEAKDRSVICSAQEFENMPFCGSGSH